MEECIVVEDYENGIKAALLVNMKYIGFKTKNSGNQDLSDADASITNFDQKTIDLIHNLLIKMPCV